MITLTLKQPVERVPLEAESICPGCHGALDNAGIRALPVYLGKRQCRVEDFFASKARRATRSTSTAI
jgi:formylmethanofuran dehydrogenase subunit C